MSYSPINCIHFAAIYLHYIYTQKVRRASAHQFTGTTCTYRGVVDEYQKQMIHCVLKLQKKKKSKHQVHITHMEHYIMDYFWYIHYFRHVFLFHLHNWHAHKIQIKYNLRLYLQKASSDNRLDLENWPIKRKFGLFEVGLYEVLINSQWNTCGRQRSIRSQFGETERKTSTEETQWTTGRSQGFSHLRKSITVCVIFIL